MEEICKYYNIARSSKKTEIKYNFKDGRNEEYHKLGCYDCDGYDKFCEKYSENTSGFQERRYS